MIQVIATSHVAVSLTVTAFGLPAFESELETTEVKMLQYGRASKLLENLYMFMGLGLSMGCKNFLFFLPFHLHVLSKAILKGLMPGGIFFSFCCVHLPPTRTVHVFMNVIF